MRDVDTLRELKKLLGLNAVTFLSTLVFWHSSTLLVGQGTIFFCKRVILTGFLTSLSSTTFFYALTRVNPLDFSDLSERAVPLFA